MLTLSSNKPILFMYLLHYCKVSKWITTSVTDMAHTFQSARSFNGSLGKWNTASVTELHFVFFNAFAFTGQYR